MQVCREIKLVLDEVGILKLVVVWGIDGLKIAQGVSKTHFS